MPVVHMSWVTVAVTDEEMRTIGNTAAHKGELLAASVLLSCQPTMSEQLEPAVIAFDHQQRFADLAAMF